jgi:hypothetical protein
VTLSRGGIVEADGADAPRRRGGPSVGCLASLLLVAAVLLLAAPALFRTGRAAYKDARGQRLGEDIAKEAKLIAAAAEAYRCDTGRLPATLDDLTQSRGGTRPYLAAVPANPASSGPDWAYDPATGAVTDPTQTWGGSARAEDAAAASGQLAQGRLPGVRGTVWGSDDAAQYSPGPPSGGRHWLYAYVFRAADASAGADLRLLGSAVPHDAEVLGVLLPPARPGGVQPRGLRPYDVATSFAILDATADAREFASAAAIDRTPVLLVCDGSLTVRGRVAGALHKEDIDRVMAGVEAYGRAVRLGR